MKILSSSKDGGPESKVNGFWIIEIKWLFSIAILKFEDGSRDAYHNHAFNCFSWLISGKLIENHIDGYIVEYTPSIFPFFTYRNTYHKVVSVGTSYLITFRGPWSKTWREYDPNKKVEYVLENRRKIKYSREW